MPGRAAYRPARGTSGQQHRSGIMAPTSPRQRVRIIAGANATHQVGFPATRACLRGSVQRWGYRVRVRTPNRPHVRERTLVGRVLLTVLSTAATLVVVIPSAVASSCLFDKPTATATVDVGNAETASIARSGDAIALNGTPCGTATVSTTDSIVVNGSGTPAAVVIDLAGGPFAPGLTSESGGDAEIEFTINLPTGAGVLRISGSSSADAITVGAGGINLNATEATGDADVTIVGSAPIEISGLAGADALSIAGGSGTGAPAVANLLGGDDDDQLFDALGGSTLDGGAGSDTADYTAAAGALTANLGTGVASLESGTDQLALIENLTGSKKADTLAGDGAANILRGGDGDDLLSGGGDDDTLDGGAGIDLVDFTGASGAVRVNLPGRTATGDGNDILADIENAIGSTFDDEMFGDDAANTLSGGDGNDSIDGGGGDDTLDGGVGTDLVDFGQSGTGVTVDLAKGTATGDGDDALSGFEAVSGTAKTDTIQGNDQGNLLIGGSGADTISGRVGNDQIVAGNGRDLLFGGKGQDNLFGGPAKDQLDGGKGNDFCRGGPDPDSFVFCEAIQLN